MTFAEWLTIWLNTYKKPNITASSLYRINTVIRKHIPLSLLLKDITKITAFDIDKALSSCIYSRTRKYMYYVLTSSLKKAFNLDMITQNIAIKTEPVRHKTTQGKALTLTEQFEFLDKLKTSKYCNVFKFYLYTGVRRSEALSLRWDEIDENSNLIYINGTKTESSKRSIFLTKNIKELLQRQRGLKNGGELVFPYDKDNISHAFKSLCPNHRLHDLRHTFITRCAESGININVCQKLAGHSDIQTTLKIYTHVTTEFQRKEFEKFDINV